MWTRHGLVRTLVALGVASGMVSAGTPATRADESASLTATAMLDGSPIPLRSVGDHHCHDLIWPVIRCFQTARERDADVAVMMRDLALASTAYVTVFQHEAYGGVSITFASDQSNLASIGWNDVITSFKSLNGGHPKSWDNANCSGTPAWQWATGAWVPNVGSGANDKISSLKNVP